MPASCSYFETSCIHPQEGKQVDATDVGDLTEMPFNCTRCRTDHETLEERYADDPELLEFHRRKLPRRGWAGKLDCTEREHVRRSRRQRRNEARDGSFASVRDPLDRNGATPLPLEKSPDRDADSSLSERPASARHVSGRGEASRARHARDSSGRK